MKFQPGSRMQSAGALNPGEPIKEPHTYGAGDVENHLPDFDLEFAIWNACRRHCFSFS
jgi:hypothetical protein